MSPRGEEFLPLSDAALRAVAGPHSRHTALLEDAFHVLLETPGGGVAIRGDGKERASAKRALRVLADRADGGAEISEADVRVAIGEAQNHGSGPRGAALPVGRRGAIAPKTAAQAHYFELLQSCELVLSLGPAGTGKTFLAVAYGASLLLRGEVDRLIVTRPAVEARVAVARAPGSRSGPPTPGPYRGRPSR